MTGIEEAAARWVSAILMVIPMRGGMVGMPDDAASVRRVADTYAAGVLAGDAAAAASVYSDDAVEMPPDRPPIRGRAAIEAYYRGFFQTCRFTTFALSHTETRTAGDVAYVFGTSRQAVAGRDGTLPEGTGKYLVVLKKSGAAWRVAYAIYNSDQAPPSAGRP